MYPQFIFANLMTHQTYKIAQKLFINRFQVLLLESIGKKNNKKKNHSEMKKIKFLIDPSAHTEHFHRE